MSSPLRKDVVEVVTIYKVPPHLSKEEFETQLGKLHDEFLTLPAFERNILKLEISRGVRVSTREELVLVRFQAKSADNMIAFLSDPDMLVKIDGVPELELQTRSNTFSIDIQPVMDRESRVDSKDRVHNFWVYKIPEHMSKKEYEQKFHKLFEDYSAVPVAQKNFVKLEKWVPNNVLQGHIHSFGGPPPEPTFMSHAEFEKWEDIIAVEQEDAVKVVLDAKGNFDFNKYASVFCADVVTKFDRS
ncbi:hypothetical protein K438DRAFT_1987687 [Mycena galopus ATCC 62051]|nr:hypothetical protein K438DRAFT_1987687 [Mycena galopus ATCC 62051]